MQRVNKNTREFGDSEITLTHALLKKAQQSNLNFGLLHLIHLLPLIAGERRAARFILPSKLAQELAGLLHQIGLKSSMIHIQKKHIGPDWWDFSAAVECSGDVLVSFCDNAELAKSIVSAELKGDFEISGAILGYPECCVNSYAAIQRSRSNWPSFYLNQSRYASAWCNRFALLFNRPCATGELFPCSLTCERAIEYGKGNMRVFDAFGLTKSREYILELSSVCIYTNANNELVSNEKSAAADRKIGILR